MSDEYDAYKRAQATRWLEHVRRLGGRCLALQAEIEEQRALASGLTGIDYGRDLVQSSPTADALPNAVSRLIDLIRDYCAELAEYVDEQRQAHAAINSVPDETCAEALSRHYLAGETWEQCCVSMGYTWDGMMKLRRRAVLMAYDAMPTAWRDPMPPAL